MEAINRSRSIDFFDLLDKEYESTDEIYVYNENGHWCAYEHSAMMISKIYEGLVSLGTYISGAYDIAINKVEIDLELVLSRCSVLFCDDTELVLSYDRGIVL